jgi:hypothetical protein
MLRESDELHPIFVSYDYNQKLFDVAPVLRDDDLESLLKSVNYKELSTGVYIDKRTIPDYIEPWELKKVSNILSNYHSIALEDLGFRR